MPTTINKKADTWPDKRRSKGKRLLDSMKYGDSIVVPMDDSNRLYRAARDDTDYHVHCRKIDSNKYRCWKLKSE